MILGNKCDMSDKRMISRERGESVSAATSEDELSLAEEMSSISDC